MILTKNAGTRNFASGKWEMQDKEGGQELLRGKFPEKNTAPSSGPRSVKEIMLQMGLLG